MHLTRSQRKITLFHARLSILAQSAETQSGYTVVKTRESEPAFVLERGEEEIRVGIARDLRDQGVLRKPQDETLAHLDAVTARLYPSEVLSPAPFSNDALGVFTFGAAIGFDMPTVRHVIDHAYAGALPTFNAMTMGWAAADRFIGSFGGLYHLYRLDRNEETRAAGHPVGVVVRATLSLRYPVPYKAYQSARKGRCRIRCKLNLPAYDGPTRDAPQPKGAPPPCYKYDGYVSPKGPAWWQWLFQSRRVSTPQRNEEDLILFYTEKLKRDLGETDVVRGVMLAQNQATNLVPTVSKILLTRAQGYAVEKIDHGPQRPEQHRASYRLTPEDERPFMRHKHGLVDLANAADWSESDRRAIEAMHAPWADVDLRGLHL